MRSLRVCRWRLGPGAHTVELITKLAPFGA